MLKTFLELVSSFLCIASNEGVFEEDLEFGSVLLSI